MADDAATELVKKVGQEVEREVLARVESAKAVLDGAPLMAARLLRERLAEIEANAKVVLPVDILALMLRGGVVWVSEFKGERDVEVRPEFRGWAEWTHEHGRNGRWPRAQAGRYRITILLEPVAEKVP